MTSLTGGDLRTLYETLVKAEKVKREGAGGLSYIFVDNPRLIVSPSSCCSCYCLHCVADSVPKGEVMPYNKFVKIDSRFIEIFSAADFGRRGNPMAYSSEGHDIADLILHLNEKGIKEFTIAAAIQERPVSAVEKLEQFVLQGVAGIETMVTYHHYFNDLDTGKLARDFNAALKDYIKFSKRIIISLLGDAYLQQGTTKAEEVERAFQEHRGVLFEGISLEPTKDDNTFHAEHNNKHAELFIPPVDTRVYPLGRFRNYLARKGILNQYEEWFECSLSDYVCPDMIKWPGIILEPDGSLNLCASLEAIASKRAIVSNIFAKPFETVVEELVQFHERERGWFIRNINDIIDGTVSTCKLRNNCYHQCG